MNYQVYDLLSGLSDPEYVIALGSKPRASRRQEPIGLQGVIDETTDFCLGACWLARGRRWRYPAFGAGYGCIQRIPNTGCLYRASIFLEKFDELRGIDVFRVGVGAF